MVWDFWGVSEKGEHWRQSHDCMMPVDKLGKTVFVKLQEQLFLKIANDGRLRSGLHNNYAKEELPLVVSGCSR